jgi:hypothetical protein
MDLLIRVGSPEAARTAVEALLKTQDRIPGFGHRIYKGRSDPRASILEAAAAKLATKAGETQWIDIARALADSVASSKGLHPNFDLYAAPAFYALKIPQDLFSSALRVRARRRVDRPRARAGRRQSPDAPFGALRRRGAPSARREVLIPHAFLPFPLRLL